VRRYPRAPVAEREFRERLLPADRELERARLVEREPAFVEREPALERRGRARRVVLAR
jgi:hypothetical protein